MPQGGNGGGPAKDVNKILGNWKDDLLIGTDGIDAIAGRGGNDTLFGLAGDDTLEGGEGDDALDGGEGADLIDGGDGNDILDGGAGDDTVLGGAGDDWLIDGDGADVLDGGDGMDTVSYAGSAFGVNIALDPGGVPQPFFTASTLISIENIEGSAFADTLIGDDGANVLSGGGGDDRLEGAAGNDVLTGGTGADLFDFNVAQIIGNSSLGAIPNGDDIITDFEIGIDKIHFTTASFDVFAGAVQVDTDVVITYGTGNTITLLNTRLGDLTADDFAFDGPSTILGTEGDDILAGTAFDDLIDGLGGNDTLSGGAGNDRLVDIDGDDVFDGGSGNDYLHGGARGIDQMTGGLGSDIFSVAPDGPDFSPSNTTTITDFEPGIDVIVLATLIPYAVLASAEQVGGDVRIVHTDGRVLVILNTQIDDIPESTFIFANPLVITGSESADLLIGNGGFANAIFGFGGDDLIGGGGGDDYLFGGEGNDLMLGGTGADQLDGGAGRDTATYLSSLLGVTIDLSTNTVGGGDAGGDTLISVENLTGSDQADFLTGDSLANLIQGLEGADTISGGDGNDVLRGNGGSDTLSGGLNDDVIVGDGGNDTLTGDAGADTFGFKVGFADEIFFGGLDSIGTDTITDFEIGVDTIWFGAMDIDALGLAVQSGGNVEINYGTGSTIVLLNIDVYDLSESDFRYELEAIPEPPLLV